MNFLDATKPELMASDESTALLAVELARRFAQSSMRGIPEMLTDIINRFQIRIPQLRLVGHSRPDENSLFVIRQGWDRRLVSEMPPHVLEALLYGYGCTVVINRFDRYDDALWDLCGSLATDHRCDVVGNLYVASFSSQSFGRHWDDHLVIAVQLSGTKLWSFFDAEGGPGTYLDSSAQPNHSILLQPGDALIVPKYIWHEVANESDALSVHVSLAFFLLSAKELFERDIARLTAFSFALEQGGSCLLNDSRQKIRRLLSELSELIDGES